LPSEKTTVFASGAVIWVLVQLLPEDQMLAWGWRLIFLSSIVVTIFAMVMRRLRPAVSHLRRVAVVDQSDTIANDSAGQWNCIWSVRARDRERGQS